MISQALAARFLNQESGLSFPTYIVACVARFCFKILDARIGVSKLKASACWLCLLTCKRASMISQALTE